MAKPLQSQGHKNFSPHAPPLVSPENELYSVYVPLEYINSFIYHSSDFSIIMGLCFFF